MGTRFLPFTQLNAVPVSSTNTYTSPSTDINQLDNAGIDVRFTGTMAGTFSVQCSNDNVVFSDLTFNPGIVQPSGSNLNFLIDVNQIPFRYIRVKYINTSGSGTLTSLLTVKDLA
jgi:hypothetical protein